MIWGTKYEDIIYPPEPKVGDIREKIRFTLIPRQLTDGRWAWLETLMFTQRYSYKRTGERAWCEWETQTIETYG